MNEDYRYIPLIRLRVLKEKDVRYSGACLDTPKRVVEIVWNLIGSTDREYLVVCCVDAKMKPTCIEIAAIGTVNACMTSPREVMKNAVLGNSYGVIVCHNHPSGIVEPSSDDFHITERLAKAGEILGIELVDHVIVGDGGNYYSFREEDKLSEVS